MKTYVREDEKIGDLWIEVARKVELFVSEMTFLRQGIDREPGRWIRCGALHAKLTPRRPFAPVETVTMNLPPQ